MLIRLLFASHCIVLGEVSIDLICKECPLENPACLAFTLALEIGQRRYRLESSVSHDFSTSGGCCAMPQAVWDMECLRHEPHEGNIVVIVEVAAGSREESRRVAASQTCR